MLTFAIDAINDTTAFLINHLDRVTIEFFTLRLDLLLHLEVHRRLVLSE